MEGGTHNVSATLSGGVCVGSPLVVRLAGLPVGVLDRLRFEESSAQVRELVRLRTSLTVQGSALAEALHEVIGSAAGRAEKPRLVGLRRALHQSRRPGGGEWNEQIAGALPADVAGRLSDWIAQLDGYGRLRAELAGVLAAETRAKHAELREIARHPAFRRALSQASLPLFAELEKWLADPDRRPRRQSVLRLARYVVRAAAKTSPFSTFTVSGAGTWVEQGPALSFPPAAAVGCVLELDGIVLASLSKTICQHPRLLRSLRLRVNPSVTFHGDTIVFVGPPPAEPIVTMSATAAVRECLRIVGQEARLTIAEVCDRLAGSASDSAEDIERFLGALVDVRLLEPQAPVPDQSADPLAELSGWLTEVEHGRFADVGALVERVRSHLCRPVAAADIEGHLARRHALGVALGELANRVGHLDEAVVRRHRDAFHESAVFTAPAVECARSPWRPALEDLDVVRRWLAALDPALPLRLALSAYVRENFGPGAAVPFLLVHRAVREELARRDKPVTAGAGAETSRLLHASALVPAAALAESALPRLRELDRIQREARGALLPAERGDGIVQVEPASLAEVVATWPGWVTPPRSLGCYVQVFGAGEALQLVLNVAHTGHGRGRTRILHLIREAEGTVPPADACPAESDAVLAELSGTFAASLNRRLPGVPYEIDYPAVSSDRPAEQRIAVGDLRVLHDPETDLVRLTSVRLDREVTPLHLGMMADILLPPAAHLLAQAFGGTYYVHPSRPLLAGAADLAVPPTVVHSPRVAVGRVVVQRAKWIAPTPCVPVRAKGDGDADYLLRIAMWLHEHGVPTRCFVRMWGSSLRDADGFAARWDAWVFDKSHKPLYTDFSSWFAVDAFERLLHRCGPVVVFEEALPAPEDAVDTGLDGPRVSEYLVELSERSGTGD
jgi:hypothetical protein